MWKLVKKKRFVLDWSGEVFFRIASYRQVRSEINLIFEAWSWCFHVPNKLFAFYDAAVLDISWWEFKNDVYGKTCNKKTAPSLVFYSSKS